MILLLPFSFRFFCISVCVIRSEAKFSTSQRWKTYALYVPATLISFGIFALSLVYYFAPKSEFIAGICAILPTATILFGILYQVEFLSFCHRNFARREVFYCGDFSKTNSSRSIRQRMKWAMWGTIAAVMPILIYQIAKRFVPSLPEDYLTVRDDYPAARADSSEFRSFGRALSSDGR